MELHFQSVLGKENIGDFTWIHQTGCQAILADMVSGTDVNQGLLILRNWLNEQQDNEVFNPFSLIKHIHTLFQSENIQAAFGVITKSDFGYIFHHVGNLRLFSVSKSVSLHPDSAIHCQPTAVLGQPSCPSVEERHLKPQDEELLMLTSDGLDFSTLCAAEIDYHTLRSGNLYRQFLPAVADNDWSALIFPVCKTQTYIRSEWPYNPFVGPQEDRFHERRGLSELATSLFSCRQFDGFRIVSCPPILSDSSSRLFDGLLIYPYGVIPLELKDHHGDIKIDVSTSKRQSLYITNNRGTRSFPNPIHKLREGLRRFGDLPALKALDPLLKNTGIVVFTSPNASVKCIYNDEIYHTPFTQAGEVLIAENKNISEALISFCKKRFGKKLKARLDESEINRIVDLLVSTPPIQQKNRHWVGDYQCSETENIKESTDYYKVYEAWEDSELSWAKCFSFDHLSSVHRQAEIQSLGREAQILNRLGKKRLHGVQYYCGKEVTEDHLYIFLEPAPELNLTEWTNKKTSRQEIISMLVSLARILESIQSVGEPAIIHRAINPDNIRIGDDGKPMLINFELCQLETLATLPINARRTFAQRYQAPEVNEPGQTLTYSADIYSLGLIAFQLLSGHLPFKDSSKELIAKGRRPIFWNSLCKDLGVDKSNAQFLQRILHTIARHRPDIKEVIEVFRSW
ncbi:NERD domain-containing protein kinase family protein [Endozoicomonas sp. 4G]|uniref:NERD domain-containing protein kinase family protein n=1 Tax=Endozoicomonas sp. 4G TaxID=2872754 RepID=UPI002078A995|nr:NERD domain-containing protein kinase family protein [Endozoicomonas sp. 4G]